jgi:hypothetical protein
MTDSKVVPNEGIDELIPPSPKTMTYKIDQNELFMEQVKANIEDLDNNCKNITIESKDYDKDEDGFQATSD